MRFFIDNPTETILKHLHDLYYFIFLSQVPRECEMWDFGKVNQKYETALFIWQACEKADIIWPSCLFRLEEDP